MELDELELLDEELDELELLDEELELLELDEELEELEGPGSSLVFAPPQPAAKLIASVRGR